MKWETKPIYQNIDAKTTHQIYLPFYLNPIHLHSFRGERDKGERMIVMFGVVILAIVIGDVLGSAFGWGFFGISLVVVGLLETLLKREVK